MTALTTAVGPAGSNSVAPLPGGGGGVPMAQAMGRACVSTMGGGGAGPVCAGSRPRWVGFHIHRGASSLGQGRTVYSTLTPCAA